jgi:hypothetical protein
MQAVWVLVGWYHNKTCCAHVVVINVEAFRFVN